MMTLKDKLKLMAKSEQKNARNIRDHKKNRTA